MIGQAPLQAADATDHAAAPARAFRYRHVVSFEETNLVGNVYFARHISWQGRCREMFLLAHAPAVLADLNRSLRLVTLNVACEYFAELRALDEIEIAMSLAYQRQHRIGLAFDYRLVRSAAGGAEFVVLRGPRHAGRRLHAAYIQWPRALPGSSHASDSARPVPLNSRKLGEDVTCFLVPLARGKPCKINLGFGKLET